MSPPAAGPAAEPLQWLAAPRLPALLPLPPPQQGHLVRGASTTTTSIPITTIPIPDPQPSPFPLL